jgi:hypothetical protein
MSAQIITALRQRSEELSEAADSAVAGNPTITVPLSNGQTAVPDESMLRWLAQEYQALATEAERAPG